MSFQGFLNIVTPTCVLLDEHGHFGTALKSFYSEYTSSGINV